MSDWHGNNWNERPNKWIKKAGPQMTGEAGLATTQPRIGPRTLLPLPLLRHLLRSLLFLRLFNLTRSLGIASQ